MTIPNAPSPASIASAAFAAPLNGDYTEVMGYMLGIQWGNTDAFNMEGDPAVPELDGIYVDGASITTLGEPRTHIWTYASGVRNPGVGTTNIYSCPCSGGVEQPGFVGDHYTCEAGAAPDVDVWQTGFVDDPLWDGAGNADTDVCPYGESPAWFHTTLAGPLQPATIEVRLMTNEPSSNEHAGVSRMELYLR